MGILSEPLQFVRDLDLPGGFAVCELGDQWITEPERRLAREWYEERGCGRYVSVDGNGRGTVTADLNLPLRKQGVDVGRFDLVTDFGTGEHVFNQFQVFRTIHELVRVGGYFVFDRPTQGYGVHCYWLANRCVFEDLAAANDYEIMSLSERDTKRGRLIRGVMRSLKGKKFKTPQQGRYKKLLRPITEKERAA